MNSWPAHESLANGHGFDPAMLSVDNSIFGNSFSNQHAQHAPPQHTGTPNSQPRSQTPQQFPYSVPSVVPSKRSRPGEDAMVASPGQPPVTMNMSRSHTPQQTPAFPSPFPYQQHLQPTGSSNATPSPTMSNQQFRPPQPQQRMQTVSPNPPQFQQQQGMAMTPPADANGRVTPQTPQFPMGGQMPNQMNQMPGQMGMPMPSQLGGQMSSQTPGQMSGQINPQMSNAGFPGGNMAQNFNPNFQGMAGMNMQANQAQFQQNAQPNLTPNLAAQQAEIQRQYQMNQMKQQQQQQQQHQLANMQRQQMQPSNMTPGMGGQQMRNMATPTRPQVQQHPPPNQQAQMAQTQFLKNVQHFMARSGQQFNHNPMLFGRPVNLYMLFTFVSKAKGSKMLTAHNAWNKIAAALQYNEMQYPNAGAELKELFEKYLGPYETAFIQHQQQTQKKMDGSPQGGMPGMSGPQMSPTKPPQTPQAAQHPHHGSIQGGMGQTPQMTPQMTPIQNNANLPMPNGYSTPQAETPTMKSGGLMNAQRKSISRSEAPNTPNQPGQPGVVSAEKSRAAEGVGKMTNGALAVSAEPAHPVDCYEPAKIMFLKQYGGVEVDSLFGGLRPIAEELWALKPGVPEPFEMGLIDVRAISNSLQSGIKREVRYALDVLLKLSFVLPINLAQCEDLLDILIDCGEDQVNILGEGATEVSDAIVLASYEDVVRNTKLELEWSLQDQPEVGSSAHNIDKAAEKLIAITRILRNLSSITINQNDANMHMLADSSVIKLLANAIRLLGTRNMLLGSHWKTLEFMKDVVHILTNISEMIELPSRDDTLPILHFLLAFAPASESSSPSELRFASYDPKSHKYYYFAIDSLAKLLLKDTNRSYFKSIFAEPVTSNSESPSAETTALPVYQQYDVITRAFGLAIASLPDRSSLSLLDERLFIFREAVLCQGILAADIICGLIPSSVSAELSRAWLHSQDFWVPSLISFCRSIFHPTNPDAYHRALPVMNRAFGMVRNLATLSLGKTSSKRAAKASGILAFGAPSSPVVNGDTSDESAIDAEATPKKESTVPKAEQDDDEDRKLGDALILDMLPNWSYVLGALALGTSSNGNMVNMGGSTTSSHAEVLRNLVALAALDE